MGLNVTGVPLEFEAVINMDTLDAQIDQLNSKLQEGTNVALQSAKIQQQGIQKTVEAYKSLETSGLKFESVIDSVGKASNRVWKSQADSVAALGEVYDKSAQDLKDYFAVLDSYNNDRVNVATNQSAPSARPAAPKKTLADSPEIEIEGLNPALLEESRKILDSLDDETKEFIKSLAQLRTRLAENQAAQKLLNKEREAGNISPKKFTQEITALAAQEKVLGEQIKETTAAQKAYEAQNNSAMGSLRQKKALLVDLADQWNNLSEAERALPEVGGDIARQFTEIRKEVQQLSLDAFTQEGEKAVSVFTQLRRIKAQIAQTDPNDPQMRQLLQDAGQLRNRLDDVNGTIKTLGSDTPGINAAIQGVRGLIGGFTALSGVVGLFTDDAEAAQKTIAQVTSAMAILNGVQEVAQVLDKNGALNQFLLLKLRQQNVAATVEQAAATAALAGAETAMGVAATGAATKVGGLNAIMAANPAGVLLVAITAVVAALTLFGDDAEEAAKKQTELNNAWAEANSLLVEMIELQIKVNGDRLGQAERAVELAQAQGLSEQAVLNLKVKAVQQAKADNEFRLKILGLNQTDIKNAQIRLGLKEKELQLLEIEISQNKKKFDNEKEHIEKLKSEIAGIKSFLDPATAAQEGIVKNDAELAQLRAEQARKAYEAQLRSDVALSEARILQSQKDSAAELAATKAALQSKAKEELANVNLTNGERLKINAQLHRDLEEADRKFHIAQLNREKSNIQAQINLAKEGSEEEFNLRLDLLNKQAEIEIANAEDNAERIEEIRTGLAKAIDEATTKFLTDSAKITAQTNIEELEAQLTRVRENSAEELELRKEIVRQRAVIEAQTALASIKNEEQLAATLKRIAAKSYDDRLKLNRDFQQKLYEENIKRIEQETSVANIQEQQVIDNPLATRRDKITANDNILQNEKKKILQEIAATELALTLKVGDTNKLLKARVTLYTQLLELLGKIQNNENKKTVDNFNDMITKAQKVSSIVSGLADAIAPFNSNLATAAKQFQDVVAIGTNLAQGAAAFATGDYLGAAAAGANFIQQIAGLFSSAKKSAEDAQRRIDQYNFSILQGEIDYNIELRKRAVIQAQLNKLTLDGLKAQQQSLEISRQQNTAEYNRILQLIQQEQFITGQTTEKKKNKFLPFIGAAGIIASLFGAGDTIVVENQLAGLANASFEKLEELFKKGQLTDKAKQLFTELQKLKAEGVDIDKQLEELKQRTKEVLTGTTAVGIADSIIEGFKQGKRSIQDFAGDFEEMMRNAILNSLKYRYLEGPINALFDQFSTFADSDGQLTESEIEQLKNAYNAAITGAGEKLKELQKITGIDISGATASQNTLTGAFKTMTEDTANLLAGQFGGLRLTMIDALNIANDSYKVLLNIEANTGRTSLQMERLLRKFDNYEQGNSSLKVVI